MVPKKTGGKPAAGGGKISVETAEQQRRAERARWPIVRFELGEEPSDDLSATHSPVECVAMMWPLAESAWKVAGLPWPAYDRWHMPGRLFRAGTPRPDSDDA